MNIRKSIFIYILLVTAVSCGQKQRLPDTDWKNENLKGEVKVVYEKKFFLDSTGVLQDSSRWNKIDSFPDLTMEFNNKGYFLYRIDVPCFFGGGTTLYTYSDKNSRLLKVTYGANMGIGGSETTFQYDSKGRIKQLVSLYPDWNTNRRDSIVTQYVKYDSRGNVLKKVHINVHDTDDFYLTYVYDKFDRVTEENKFDLDDNTPRTKQIYKYDTNGNQIYSEFKHLDGTKWGWVSTASYDDKGNELKHESSYNDNGKPWNPDPSEYRYEYDKLGNWTQRILNERGKDKEVTRRKIIYW